MIRHIRGLVVRRITEVEPLLRHDAAYNRPPDDSDPLALLGMGCLVRLTNQQVRCPTLGMIEPAEGLIELLVGADIS